MGAGILCIIIGIIIILLYGDYKKIPNAKKTVGNICAIEWDKEINSDSGRMFYGHIQYFVDGKEYYIKTKDTSQYGYRKGKQIIVKYNRENPSQAIRIHSFTEYLMPLFWIAFGIYVILTTLGSVPSIFS